MLKKWRIGAKMTVSEIIADNRTLDECFNSVVQCMGEVEEDFNEERELDWWMNKYPTLEKAENALLEKNKELKNLDKNNFDSFIDYISKVSSIDREIMMLEMLIDELYDEWSPKGSQHSDFQIGTVFRSGKGRWLCTDIGTRTIIGIPYTPRRPDDMNGPPYFLQESVFDEHDIQALDILENI